MLLIKMLRLGAEVPLPLKTDSIITYCIIMFINRRPCRVDFIKFGIYLICVLYKKSVYNITIRI